MDMSPGKRFTTKIESSHSQRKITQYFPKTDKWQDFTLAIPMKKAQKRTYLAPEIISYIDLLSSEDEFQARNCTISNIKRKNGEVKPVTKKKKLRKKRMKKNGVANLQHEPNNITVEQSETSDVAIPDSETNDNVNYAEFLQTVVETHAFEETCVSEIKEEPDFNILQDTSISETLDNPENIPLQDTILHETVGNPHSNIYIEQSVGVNLPSCTPSDRVSENVDLPNIANKGIELCNVVPKLENFILPQLTKVCINSANTDSVCINKPRMLTNSYEKSKCVILQSNTTDLFSVDDEMEELEPRINNTIVPSEKISDVVVDNNKNDPSNSNLYLEHFARCNKENFQEICNTLPPPNTIPEESNILPKSEPLSVPSQNSIDIVIATFEPEEPNAMDSTLITEDGHSKNDENIHDVLVELHQALDRIENVKSIDPGSPYYKMYFLRKVIRNVVENFDMLRLLRDVERRTLVNFLMMDTRYQYFCFRLFTRLPKWYNMYKLIETIKLDMDQKEVSEMYCCLQENNFIQTDYSQESISTLLHQLERSALVRIQTKFKIKRGKYNTKEFIIDSLISYCNTQTTLSANYKSDDVLYKLISDEIGPCAKLENNFYTTLSRVHLLNSFTNQELLKNVDLYFFLFQIEKGDVILPSYDVECAVGNIFPRRQDFLLYSKAAEYKLQFILKMEKTGKCRDWTSIKEICDSSYIELHSYLLSNTFQTNTDLMNRFTAGHKYASILTEASKHLTKIYTDDVEKWLILLLQQYKFCQKRRGLWYDRLALIKSTYKKDADQAADVVLRGLIDPLVSESGRREILNRGICLMKRKTNKVQDIFLSALKCKIPNSLEKKYSIRNIQGKQQPGNQGKCYYLQNDGDHRTYYGVEEYSIKHYVTQLDFTDGVHCESALFSTLFAVLFWDVIYDEYIAGTFLNNLQVYPLDYFTRDFYINREDIIDDRLEQIARVWSDECYEGIIRNNFEHHKNKRCGIVEKLFKSGEQLVTIVKCIGRENLAIVMRKWAVHLGDMNAGLPDLFVWNSVTFKCKFVEVKSEKDKLSMKQILWLNFLISANLDAEVCHVLPNINTSTVPASKRATVE